MIGSRVSSITCILVSVTLARFAIAQECLLVSGRSVVPDEVFEEPAIVRAMATDGRYVAFTVPLFGGGSSYNDGRVYYYDTHGDRRLQRLTVPGVHNLQFGCDISIADGIAYVGARGERVWGSPAVGSVYVYDLSSGEQIGHLAPPTFVPWGFFGSNLWVHGDRLFVRSSSVATTEQVTGSVYMYDRHSYEYIAEIIPDYLYNGGFYGASHAVNHDFIAISERFRRDHSGWERGAVFLFDAVTGALVHEFQANDRENTSGFGIAVTMNDRHIAVHCRRLSFRGRYDHGVVQVFDLATGNFLYELQHPSVVHDYFGSTLESMGDRLIVGDPLVYGIDGGFRVYRFSDGKALQSVIKEFDGSSDNFGFGEVLDANDGKLFVRVPHPSQSGVAVSAAEFTERSLLLDRVEPFGQIDIADFMQFLTDFINGDMSADIAEPYGLVDFFDLARFVRLYSGFCE